MTDNFKKQMDECKLTLAVTVQTLAHRGIPPHILAASLGSAAGNMVGLLLGTDNEEELRAMIENMVPAMVKDAQLAAQFQKKLQN